MNIGMNRAAVVLLALGLSGCVTVYDSAPQDSQIQPYQPNVVTPTWPSTAAQTTNYADFSYHSPAAVAPASAANGATPATPPYPASGTAAPQPCVGICYGVTSPITGRPRNTYVRGYTRRDGTYVRPHTRSSRN